MSLTMAMLSAGFNELISVGCHFLALGVAYFSTLHPFSKMKIPASLPVRSS